MEDETRPLEAVADDRQEELALGPEQLEQVRLRDPDGAGDRVGRRARVPAFREGVERGDDDRIAALVCGLAARGRCAFMRCNLVSTKLLVKARIVRTSRYDSAMAGWTEIGDRVFVRRYAFFDQNIGVVLGDGEALVIDTRSTHAQAREILTDLRELTADPVTVVVDTHGHFDHVYGNHVFRPATIWGHERCVTFMAGTASRGGQRSPPSNRSWPRTCRRSSSTRPTGPSRTWRSSRWAVDPWSCGTSDAATPTTTS